MLKSKLIRGIRSIEKARRKDFIDFISSPYFNKHKYVKELGEYIIYHIDSDNKLSKNSAAAYLFKDDDRSEQRLADLMTYLYRQFLNFIYINSKGDDDFDQDHTVADHFLERGIIPDFERHLKKAAIYNDGPESETTHYRNFQISDLRNKAFLQKGERKQDNNIQNKVESLDKFYFISKLKNSCEMLNMQNIIKSSYSFSFIEEAITYLETTPEYLNDSPLIKLYLKAYFILRSEKNDNAYFELKKLLEEYSKQIKKEDAQILYNYAQNFCIKKINLGEQKFLNEILDLYKLLLSSEVIFEGDYLSQWDFKNIVTVGIRVKDYDWTESFINEYFLKLKPEEQLNARTYNLANLNYARNEKEHAMHLLSQVEFTDIFYGLDSRSLLLRIYFELNEFESLYSLIYSFKIYLKRSKMLSPTQYRLYMNFLKAIKKLSDIKEASVSMRKETLLKRIIKLEDYKKGLGNILNAKWFDKQVNSLKPA